jgi:hypothetical protein
MLQGGRGMGLFCFAYIPHTQGHVMKATTARLTQPPRKGEGGVGNISLAICSRAHHLSIQRASVPKSTGLHEFIIRGYRGSPFRLPNK